MSPARRRPLPVSASCEGLGHSVAEAACCAPAALQDAEVGGADVVVEVAELPDAEAAEEERRLHKKGWSTSRTSICSPTGRLLLTTRGVRLFSPWKAANWVRRNAIM